jgi:hypothetical protein
MPATVRRLLAQLDGASSHEVAALGAGGVNLAIHAVIARHVEPGERPGVLSSVARSSIKTKELEGLFVALGWQRLVDLGPHYREQRLILLGWALGVLEGLPHGSAKERLRDMALQFPLEFETSGAQMALVSR